MPKLDRKRLGQLGARDVRQFLAALTADGVVERTAQLAHAVLRAALEDAMREEIIPRNVAKLVRAPRGGDPYHPHAPISLAASSAPAAAGPRSASQTSVPPSRTAAASPATTLERRRATLGNLRSSC
ncbi:hypothetical protein GCM10011608_58790 [Micromonospora sonchi]|uniref:Core-binding (CB) domain-containing protein n=1 Tax=Micromonospora sonchi TaxID=1763543 RepID=A0A917UAZ2_9ACTN|nr:hypothetical protein GCM10011608_58790 [Micromonospora sonchi]